MKELDDMQFKFLWWVYYNWMPEIKRNDILTNNVSEYSYILYGSSTTVDDAEEKDKVILKSVHNVLMDIYYEELSTRLRLIIDNRKYAHEDKELLNRVKELWAADFLIRWGS